MQFVILSKMFVMNHTFSMHIIFFIDIPNFPPPTQAHTHTCRYTHASMKTHNHTHRTHTLIHRTNTHMYTLLIHTKSFSIHTGRYTHISTSTHSQNALIRIHIHVNKYFFTQPHTHQHTLTKCSYTPHFRIHLHICTHTNAHTNGSHVHMHEYAHIHKQTSHQKRIDDRFCVYAYTHTQLRSAKTQPQIKAHEHLITIEDIITFFFFENNY